jgi:hypothetical protein
MSRTGLAALVSVLTLASAVPAAAVDITGFLKFGFDPSNYYDPAEGGVPPGYGNTTGETVTVGPGVEFGYGGGGFLDTADITTTTLKLTTTAQVVGTTFHIFTPSAPGFFDGITLVSATFDDFTWSVNNGVLGMGWLGTFTPGTYAAEFAFGRDAPGIPEPHAWAIMIMGFSGAGAALRARRRESFF